MSLRLVSGGTGVLLILEKNAQILRMGGHLKLAQLVGYTESFFGSK